MSQQHRFYLGKALDRKSGKLGEPTLYDPDDLTTHGVVVGMTGSGKTGLCVTILEEAALAGIPALMVDPKGDIANLLLHFPRLEPDDFLPWINPDEARRKNMSPEALAADTAKRWASGLADWDIPAERIARVREQVAYAVYTPGSDAGIPVDILASFRAPEVGWDQAQETLRERIASTVTALLTLIGVEADPVRSREHILLASIFEHAWRGGSDLDLAELIRQVQTPPFDRLGALNLEQFFPPQDRLRLASDLNGLLASPSFRSWITGQSLDIDSFLWTEEQKPRQSVFYLAHLSDAERMFFVTLLLTAVEGWLRAQPGSSSLRALLYFDELFGYLPPVANPPSKQPLLRLLKTARAYGLGLLLVTQNPADLDYKGLGNAGTWFVGKLQAERDKLRLLDGLESTEAASIGYDRKAFDQTLSDLDQRQFLLHNVHAAGPTLFQSRWAMAYLRGPITRAKLGELNALVGAALLTEAEPKGAVERPGESEPLPAAISQTRPELSGGIVEYFLSNNLTVAQALKAAGRQAAEPTARSLLYRPALLAQATARFLDRKLGLDFDLPQAALVREPEGRSSVRWEDHATEALPPEVLETRPVSGAGFADLSPPLNDGKWLKRLEADFLDYVYHTAKLSLPANPALDLLAAPEETPEAFQARSAQEAEKALQSETKKASAKYQKQIAALKRKLSREERELAEDQAELSARKMEEMATHAENVLGLFTKSRSSRRVSTSLTKRRLTEKAKADVEESIEAIDEFKAQLAELEDQLAEELDTLQDHWSESAAAMEERTFTPYKKDIVMDHFGIAWHPYWQLSVDGQAVELPAFHLLG